jgi:hypothetical protein
MELKGWNEVESTFKVVLLVLCMRYSIRAGFASSDVL